MIVAQGDGCDLHEAIKESIAVHIAEVVSIGLFIVGKKCHRGHLLHGVELFLESHRSGSRHSCFDVDGWLPMLNWFLENSLYNLLLGLVGRNPP